MKQTRLALVLLTAAVVAAGCATNPVSGRAEMAMMSEASEIKLGKQTHVQITQMMGVYDDLDLQDYVQRLGEKLARASHRPNLEWKFTIVDTDDVNAFATPGGFVYISRGILPYLKNEAELAAVLGHEIAHITARHGVQQQSKSTLAGIASAAAAIFTGQPALGDLANVAGQAIIRGYGREAELEADKLGAEYLAATNYDPEAIIEVVSVLKDQELFERERARIENRDARIYHGLFSTHPDNDTRLQNAVRSAKRAGQVATGEEQNQEVFLKAVNGLAVGSSRRQGMVRDNRFYHADFQFTVAFPSGWQVQNQPDKILAIAPGKDHVLEVTTQAPPPGITSPRQFVTRGLANFRLDQPEDLKIGGFDAFTAVVRQHPSPFGPSSNVRYVVINYGNLMWIFKGASRAGNPAPEGDRLFLSAANTFRRLRSNEFALAEPHRLQILKATSGLTVAALAKDAAIDKYVGAAAASLQRPVPGQGTGTGKLDQDRQVGFRRHRLPPASARSAWARWLCLFLKAGVSSGNCLLAARGQEQGVVTKATDTTGRQGNAPFPDPLCYRPAQHLAHYAPAPWRSEIARCASPPARRRVPAAVSGCSPRRLPQVPHSAPSTRQGARPGHPPPGRNRRRWRAGLWPPLHAWP